MIEPTHLWPEYITGSHSAALDRSVEVWGRVEAFFRWYMTEGHPMGVVFDARQRSELSERAAVQLNWVHNRFWSEVLPAWDRVWNDEFAKQRQQQREWLMVLANDLIYNNPDLGMYQRYWGPYTTVHDAEAEQGYRPELAPLLDLARLEDWLTERGFEALAADGSSGVPLREVLAAAASQDGHRSIWHPDDTDYARAWPTPQNPSLDPELPIWQEWAATVDLQLVSRYPRLSTDRNTAEQRNLEWITPGHSLFEALCRHSLDAGQAAFARGACFHSLEHETPARIDFYRARVVDGLDHIIHERLFAVELSEGGAPRLRSPDILGNLSPAAVPGNLPSVAALPEATAWLNEHAFTPFIDEVRAERLSEVDRIADHVELSLTEVLQRIDQEIGRASEDLVKQVTGAEGRLAQAEARHDEARARRDRRRFELTQQRALTLQGVERLAGVLILPHPDSNNPEVRRLRPNRETEQTAMQVVMDYETAQGRRVVDVHEENLGYDVTSLDTASGELRLIEVKGLAAKTGTILLTPNERRVAEDRRDCYWLYVVTNCATVPELREPIRDPARFPWHEVTKVQHYWLNVDAMS